MNNYLVVILFFLILILISDNSCIEPFGSGPIMFIPEGYGEKVYYDNDNLEPLYRTSLMPTIYD